MEDEILGFGQQPDSWWVRPANLSDLIGAGGKSWKETEIFHEFSELSYDDPHESLDCRFALEEAEE